MSVSLEEVLTAAGYDVKSNPEDAQWLLSQRDDWDDLTYSAEQCVDDYEEYEEYLDEKDEDDEVIDFETWRDEK